MDILQLPLFTRLAVLSLLLAPAHAQNNTTTSDQGSCSVDFNPDAPVNATGSRNIHWSALMMDPARNDWIFTLTYNETRDLNGTVHRWESFISASEESEANACTFMLGGLNKTSSSTTKHGGCDGVIDDACTSILREIMYLGDDCSWPEPRDEYFERLRQACGTDILSTGIRTHRPVDLSNGTTNCKHSKPPGSSSPDDYRTYLSASFARDYISPLSDRNTSDFTWYDIYAKQTVPFVIAAHFLGGVAETQVLCMNPNEVAEGSRIPAHRSTASSSQQPSTWLGIIAALAAFMLEVLT
ncbi:hypothetical protein SVAN01_04061 [Stagonosporopsis vannaccii]|nr:hypothetical protein SVAN01_04061 [Stagonosporopsis vannaccii]